MSRVTVNVIAELTLEIDDTIMPDDEWREHMFPIHTMEEVAEHIAYNMVRFDDYRLHRIDGFADRQDEQAKVVEGPFWMAQAVRP